jgi:hypothetical protein
VLFGVSAALSFFFARASGWRDARLLLGLLALNSLSCRKYRVQTSSDTLLNLDFCSLKHHCTFFHL